jgi:hypothetical protein
MKNPPAIFLTLALAVSAAQAAKVPVDNNSSTAPARIQSVFIIPTGTKDGRDPFFPESTRLKATPTTTLTPAVRQTMEISSLKFQGISGTPGSLVAIINDHAFAVGDDGDVITGTGRVHIRCLEIQADHVTLEINGQAHRINFQTK